MPNWGMKVGFRRLLETDRGIIILLNLHETVREGLLDPTIERELLRKISDDLLALPTPFSNNDLYSLFQNILWQGWRYQLRSREIPSGNLRISAVRSYDDIHELVKRIGAQFDPPELDSLMPPPAAPDTLRIMAELITRHTVDMPHLTVGRGFNAFWATSQTELAAVEAFASDPVHEIRDRLGLVQHDPADAARPIDLFVFEGQVVLDDIPDREAFRFARPNTLDGFTNQRFRQARPAALSAIGCGATVDLTGGIYRDGLPELISTEMPLRGSFHCRYLGRIVRSPLGSDSDFVSYLAAGRDPTAIAVELSGMAAV